MASVTTTKASLGTPTAQTKISNAGPDTVEITQGDRLIVIHPNGSEIFLAGTELFGRTLHTTATVTLTDATLAHLTLTGGHIAVTGPAITAAAGTGAGTSPPDPVVTGCTDISGTITFGTGTTAAAGSKVDVTFGRAYDAAPDVVLVANNTATEALGCYAASAATTGFSVSTTAAGADSQANTVYSVSYSVLA